MCMLNHVSSELVWDEVLHLACGPYNFVPNEHSKENAFLSKSGRDANATVVQLLNLKLRSVGDDYLIFGVFCSNVQLILLVF